AAAQPLPAAKPVPPPKAAPEPKPPVAAAPQKPPKKAAAPPPAPAPVAPPKPAAPSTAGNDYGPVAQGETLSEIARATRPDEKTNINQMMLALLKANPKAFYQDNINALRRGAILRIPSSDDIRASGAISEAVAQVHSQNEAWTSKAPVTAPTLVAHTGTPATAAPAKPAASDAGSKSQERLALVPPRAGKGDAGTDRVGAAGGTGKDDAATKAELTRTKEALTSREQEAAELKSRVKQLEDIGSKDQRLISMKDSEIAELQAKLKDLQAKTAASAAAAAAKPPVATTAAPPPAAAGKPDQKVTAKDIWGDMSAADKAAADKATADKTAAGKPAAGTPAATTSPSSATAAVTTTPTPNTTTPPAATPSTSSAASNTPPASTTPAATTPAATPEPTTGSAAATSPPATPSTGSASSTDTAVAAASSPASSTDTSASASKPATTAVAPVKSAPAAKVLPLEPAGEPFYKNQNVLLGGGAALLLVGLLALMRFMRKPKPFAVGGMVGGEGDLGPDAVHEEERLLDTLRQDPGNSTASLELLRHYYARGDAARFEEAAEQMHAHLVDPAAPEWDEVLAMGAVLAPHNPLFGQVSMHEHEGGEAHAHAEPPDEFVFSEPMHTQAGTFDDRPLHAGNEPAVEEQRFDFDLPVRAEDTPPDTATLFHEPLPDFTREHEQHAAESIMDHHVEAPAEPQPEHAHVAQPDELFVGEDAIGTKLDLAKAYLDMGDPEGARSMLDEVMSEGNDSQKDEARKLLAEIK
ncbi:MAG TPA: FimV/HubP family polar landmark protein, partial [Rhodanobacteraceae bacterium]|nr:FimV/HubP family polar landmark protein [Rhodanobacteraceae bacterium]